MEKIELPIKKDNISPTNPDFKWLTKMIIIIVLFFLAWYIAFYSFAHLIIAKISLEDEKKYFKDTYISSDLKEFDTNLLINKIKNIENIDIYIQKSDEVNAYAILWWNIIITSWLIKNIKYEEELIFIIWHEKEHIINRDVLRALLTELPFTLTLQFLWFDFWNDLKNISNLSNNYISKNIELNSDNWWIELINEMWLNLNCSLNFFEKDNGKFYSYLQIISTHPINKTRIENIKKNNINRNKDCTIINENIKKDY